MDKPNHLFSKWSKYPLLLANLIHYKSSLKSHFHPSIHNHKNPMNPLLWALTLNQKNKQVHLLYIQLKWVF